MDTEKAIEKRQRWNESRKRLHDASSALRAGRLDEALQLFSQAHDLGDDNVLCHTQGHLGRARVEMRKGRMRDASVDVFFGLLAVLVSSARLLRGVRGRGFGGESGATWDD